MVCPCKKLLAQIISNIKTTDSSQVDFTNPECFFHDVNSVAGLLKQFFRDLPEPLFTAQFYPDFINAARKHKPTTDQEYDFSVLTATDFNRHR